MTFHVIPLVQFSRIAAMGHFTVPYAEKISREHLRLSRVSLAPVLASTASLD